MADVNQKLSLESVIVDRPVEVSKETIARVNQDGTVIVMKLDESSLFYKIDGIAAEVWSCLTQQKTTTELLREIETKYPTFKSQLSSDVPQFIGELLKKNLLTYC